MGPLGLLTEFEQLTMSENDYIRKFVMKTLAITKKARIITQEGQSWGKWVKENRDPGARILERRSGGKFKFDITISSVHHLIMFIAQNIYFL